MIFAGVGMLMTRKIENEKIKKKLQEMFVYECSMIFGFSVLLLLMNTFGIIDESKSDTILAPMIIFFVPIFHIFYFLTSINRRLKIANKIGVLFFGIILSMTGIIELGISFALALVQSGII